jgi:Phytanoyl-CoA dioxygenase (PhyH)
VTRAGSEERLTRAAHERFEHDGYLVLDSTGCSADVLAGAVAELEGRYEGDGRTEGGVFYHRRRIQDAWRASANVRALALSRHVHAILAALYGRTPLPFQTLNFHKGSEQAPHSDTIHFNSEPAGFMCGVWVALEDIDMENGPLVYYPGSHRLPEVTMQDVGVAASEDQYPHYERYIADVIERRGLEPAYGTIRRGQALIWSANLLHGGLVQHDPSRTRHSQVTHYFFEDCRYYTPMMSGEDHVERRHPTWVSEEEARKVDDFAGYDAGRIRAIVDVNVPAGESVIVVSGGDDELLALGGRQAVHFPQNADGTHAGYHPASSEDAVSELERLRAAGAGYLLLPNAAFWWLDHYTGLADTLDASGEIVARDDQCLVFALRRG